MFIKTTQSRTSTISAMPTARRQRGDTMIEVLVTIIIIAVGVLGTAALQVTTLKNLNSSHSASTAAIGAEDFSERMLANPIATLADNYVHTSAPGSYPDCVANACTPAQLATFDMGTWWADLAGVLPAGRGQVTRNAGTNTFVLTVRWDEDRSGSTGTNCPPQSDTDLECFRLNVTI